MGNESQDDDKLPPNWTKRISKQKSCGRPYYVNLVTKEISWKRPKCVRNVHTLDRSSLTISRKNSNRNSSTPAQDRLIALQKDLACQQKERLKSDKNCLTPANDRLKALKKDLIRLQKERLKSDKNCSTPAAQDRLLQAFQKDPVCQQKEKKDSKCLVESGSESTEKRQWNDKKMIVKPAMQTKTKQKNQKVRRELQQMYTKSTPISMPKSNDYEGECSKINNTASDITWTSLSANASTSASSSFTSFSSNSSHNLSLANSSHNSSTCSTDSYNHHHNDNQRGASQSDNTFRTMYKAHPTPAPFIDDSLKPSTSTNNETLEDSKPTQSKYLNSSWAHPYSKSATSLFGKFETKKFSANHLNEFSANDRLKKIHENFQLHSPTAIQSTIHKSPSLTESRLCCEDVLMNERQVSTIDDLQDDKMDWDDEEIFEEISLVRRIDDCSDNVESSSSNNNVDASNTLSLKLLCIVIDTNIFLSQMVFLSNLLNKIDEITGSPKLIIPYVVLQELDKLKMRTERAVSLLASRAIRFINTQLNLRNDKILGQSALDHKKKLIEIDSADDNIVNCCLQFKQTYGHVILLTNDINLRNKSMCSNIESLSKSEFESKFLLKSSES